MTTSGMSYGEPDLKRNGLQDEPTKKNKYKQNVPPSSPQPTKPTKPNKLNNDLPNVLLCFKSAKSDIKKEKDVKKEKEETDKSSTKSKKRSKSRELRGGVLYVGCECERRNGLQDQCPRSECQGSPECLTVPPTCPPSEFASAKHITQMYNELLKRREEFQNKLNSTGKGEKNVVKKNGNSDKVDYDCFPLDKMIQEGQPCPICDRTIESCPGTKKEPDIVIGPIIVDFPVDCLCCPEAD